jgi:hypothetical protein
MFQSGTLVVAQRYAPTIHQIEWYFCLAHGSINHYRLIFRHSHGGTGWCIPLKTR